MNELLHQTTVAPSILSADPARFGEQTTQVLQAGARVIHVDVMDGHFVPNITIGPLVVQALAPLVHAHQGIVDVHLMIKRPELFVERFVAAGADVITVHQEACRHLHRVLSQVRGAGAAAGVALNPATPVETLAEARAWCDLVLVMSVNPGFGGQEFIPTSLAKLQRARAFLPSSVALEVDGGVGTGNAASLVAAGATVLVAGSSVFATGDPAERFRELQTAATA